jgi:hypothetical protein
VVKEMNAVEIETVTKEINAVEIGAAVTEEMDGMKIVDVEKKGIGDVMVTEVGTDAKDGGIKTEVKDVNCGIEMFKSKSRGAAMEECLASLHSTQDTRFLSLSIQRSSLKTLSRLLPQMKN